MGREITYAADGTLISDTDDRTLDKARAETLAAIREAAALRIETAWPQWKQLNTLRAGGDKLAQMGNEIDAIRAASNVAQAEAMAANALPDLYAVRW